MKIKINNYDEIMRNAQYKGIIDETSLQMSE